MRRITTLLLAISLCLTLAAPAPSLGAVGGGKKGKAKAVLYEGKTSGGHKVSFKLRDGKALQFETGVPMSCLAIQGGGAPISGVEPFVYTWIRLGNRNAKLSDYIKPSFHYNEVTRNHTVTLLRVNKNVIRGAIRTQYEFMIPKFPIGTFTIYSCLGEMKFNARPVRG